MPDKISDVTDNKVGKITDNEIVKALEEWRKELIADYQRLQLLDAPMDCFEESHANTITKLTNALDLINRQKEEIEELKLKNLNLTSDLSSFKNDLSSAEAEIENLRNSKYIFTSVDYCESDLTEALKENDMLKAEIERLKENLGVLTFENLQFIKTNAKIKSEAYKEFAEKLHEELRIYGIKDKFNKSVFLNVVDKAKKELGGDENER